MASEPRRTGQGEEAPGADEPDDVVGVMPTGHEQDEQGKAGDLVQQRTPVRRALGECAR